MARTFGLGDVVCDRISGLKGVVTARTEWLNGCVRYGIQPQELHDGKPVDEQWFDEQRLEKMSETELSRLLVGRALAGGPTSVPQNVRDPS